MTSDDIESSVKTSDDRHRLSMLILAKSDNYGSALLNLILNYFGTGENYQIFSISFKITKIYFFSNQFV